MKEKSDPASRCATRSGADQRSGFPSRGHSPVRKTVAANPEGLTPACPGGKCERGARPPFTISNDQSELAAARRRRARKFRLPARSAGRFGRGGTPPLTRIIQRHPTGRPPFRTARPPAGSGARTRTSREGQEILSLPRLPISPSRPACLAAIPIAAKTVTRTGRAVSGASGQDKWRRRRADSNRRIEVLQTSALATWLRRPDLPITGAGHGIRTRDFNLGKVALYH